MIGRMSIVFLGSALLAAAAAGPVQAAEERAAGATSAPKVQMKTSKGEIVIELFTEKAPITVENFLRYVREGFYDGTIFHRVLPGFVIQGGGFTPDMKQKSTHPSIKNEATNGLKNLRGTLSMARTPNIDSATSQFFINLVDNASLDHRDTTAPGYGYAVFGKVVEGMEVVDAIAKVPTRTVGRHEGVPKEPIIVETALVIGEEENKEKEEKKEAESEEAATE